MTDSVLVTAPHEKQRPQMFTDYDSIFEGV